VEKSSSLSMLGTFRHLLDIPVQYRVLTTAQKDEIGQLLTVAEMSPMARQDLFDLVAETLPVYEMYLERKTQRGEVEAFKRSLIGNTINDAKAIATIKSIAPRLLDDVAVAAFKIGKEWLIFSDASVAIVSDPGFFGSKAKGFVMHQARNDVSLIEIGNKQERIYQGTTHVDSYSWTLRVLCRDGSIYTRELYLGTSEADINQNRRYWSRTLNKIATAYPLSTDGGSISVTSGYTLSFGIGVYF